MTLPGWLAVLLAAAMLAVTAGSVVRLAIWRLRGRAAEPEADALHIVMGVAMAGMFEPRMRMAPDAAWMAMFAAAAAWFAVQGMRGRSQHHQAGGWRPHPRSWRSAHPALHSVECAAMIYMLVPAGVGRHASAMAMPGMPGATTSANPAVAFVLALFMLGSVVWTADRLTRQARLQTDQVSGTVSGGTVSGGAEPAGPDAADVAGRAAGAVLAPRAADCSKIAMSLAMGYMLLTML